MRTPEELHESAQAVLERAYLAGAYTMAPLFSGGHDSLCAVHLASQHRAFKGIVHHINTGIGSKYILGFVHRTCDQFGWKLMVHKSNDTYEQFIRDRGFPGPAMHGFAYQRLKDRCVYSATKGKAWKMLITGCRSQESVRRMGSVEPVKFGEWVKNKKTGLMEKRNRKRIWTAPCHDWSKAEQIAYMDEHGLPINKMKIALGMSGECFCGAFAQPGEFEAIKEHAPDVAAEIDRLTVIAKECGKPCVWGQRPAGEVATELTGEMCQGCDRRAAASGLLRIA